MLSVSAYDLITEFPTGEEPIKEVQHFAETAIVSGTEEKLETYIFINEITENGYRNYRIISELSYI